MGGRKEGGGEETVVHYNMVTSCFLDSAKTAIAARGHELGFSVGVFSVSVHIELHRDRKKNLEPQILPVESVPFATVLYSEVSTRSTVENYMY